MTARVADTTQSFLGLFDLPESDPIIRRLHDTSFDSVDFLNKAILLSTSSNGLSNSLKSSKVAQIQDTAAQVQRLLAKLNALNIRYSNTLSQLTDEILRSGSRLTYEVEILRADVNGLSEAFTDTLQDDLKSLGLGTRNPVPNILKDEDGTARQGSELGSTEGATSDREPSSIPQLRMLSQVKTRLEEVINVFGEAMEWPIAPSELSVTSSLISISGPEPDSDTHIREEKAREASKRLRSQVTKMLDQDGGDYAGLEAAAARVESLRSLTTVWNGTAEEKPRTNIVGSLSRLVDDRRKLLDASQGYDRQRRGEMSQQSKLMPERLAASQLRADRNANDSSNQSGGIFRNLQRLRDDFYLD